ncbi:MAG: polysaccharide biosynthesis C-terminal domain-containing protein [Acidobacteria bacterium]|nr:polysaccharide biosynthesis C-terminal domain-containing protein [Acidobacteriota bacterium]
MFAAIKRTVNGQSRLFTQTLVVGGFLAAAKLAGAVKIVLMASRFGAGDQLDAFLAAFSLPAFFSDVVAGSLPAALVPALIAARESRGRAAMERLHGSVTLLVLSLLAGTAVVLAIGAPLFVGLIASGFEEGKRALSLEMFCWLLLLVPCGGLAVMWRAALISEERFKASSLAVGITPLTTVFALLFAKPGANVWILVWATLAGVMLELLVLGGAVRRAGIRLLPRWKGRDSAIASVMEQYLPLIAAAAISGGNLMLDQAMAATLPGGSVSALNYGIKLAAVIAAVAGGALGTAILPVFSRLVSAGNWSAIRETLQEQSRLILLISIPLCATMILFSSELVALVFQRNVFTTDTAQLIASTQRYSLPQVPVALLLAMALRLVSAMGANALLLRVALVTAVLNAAGDYFLMRWMGVPGIALASTLAMAAAFILVIFEIRKRMPTRRVLDCNAP